MLSVKIKKVRETSKIPEFQNTLDVCADLYSDIEEGSVVLQDGDTKLIPTGIAMQLPIGYEAVIRPRSGLTKKGIVAQIGTIDTGYRGEVYISIHNQSGDTYTVQHHDRLAQMAVRQTPNVEFQVVDELDDTDRGEHGFGSTGK